MHVILVHLGWSVPAYARVAARQAEAVGGTPATLVGPLRARRYHGRALRTFRATERLSDMGLHGFWRFACERFFVLEEAMGELGLERCLHIESDTLLYTDPAEYVDWAQATLGPAVATCPLTDTEDTASIMYVGSRGALSAFNEGLLELVAKAPEALLAEHGGQMANEMRMLRILRDRGLAAALPVTPAQAAEAGAPCVFDPASYGQLADGTPQLPGRSVVGDHQIAGREILAGNARLLWDARRVAPLLAEPGGREWPLANLHVHSKRLERWATEPEPEPPSEPAPPTALRRRADWVRAAAGMTVRRIRRARYRSA